MLYAHKDIIIRMAEIEHNTEVREIHDMIFLMRLFCIQGSLQLLLHSKVEHLLTKLREIISLYRTTFAILERQFFIYQIKKVICQILH